MARTTEQTPPHAARKTTATATRPAAATQILLVEDEPLTAEVYERALGRDGYKIEIARDGLQALRRLQERSPSLVIVDLSLPTVSGVDVVRSLRRRGDDVPVLVVSGSQPWQCTLTEAELQPGRWLTKPVKPRELLQVARELIARSGGAR